MTIFVGSLENVTSKWDTSSNGTKDGLVVFLGNMFSPSVETLVTQGRHKLSLITWILVSGARELLDSHLYMDREP